MCSQSVEKASLKVSGVVSASVTLMDKSLSVTVTEDFNETELKEKIEKLGYVFAEYGEKKDKQANVLKKRFIFSLIFLLPLMYFSMGAMLSLPVPSQKINLIIQFILALVVITINFAFYVNGVKAVLNKSPNMDTLVFLGSISALIYSVLVTVFLFLGKATEVHAFYEASAMVLSLVTLGKWLEERAKSQTRKDVEKLSSLIPKTVYKITDGKEEKVFISALQKGDVVIFRVGDYIAVDGKVVEGLATIDNSAITGESMPFEVEISNSLVSGGIVKSGYVKLQVEKTGEDTYFSQIVKAVERAGASKSPVQKVADKISAFFVPTVVALALITFGVWMGITGSVYTAIKYGISVLVISCPCSLGLATPVAITCGVGVSAKHGVLFKDAEALTELGKINCVLFDKTATLTEGKPKVTDYKNFSTLSDDKIFTIVASLEINSSHPLKECLLEFCSAKTVSVNDFTVVAGKGVTGVIDGGEYLLGNFAPFGGFDGKTTVTLSNTKGEVLSAFGIFDGVKEDSKSANAFLTENGVVTAMITGDNLSSANIIAKECGIERVHAGVLPTEKAELVSGYKAEGYKVAFVGDGINDAPALKTADVGVAIGSGTDIAVETADVVLVSGKTSSLKHAIKISKKTYGIIKGNLFWAFIYNVLAMPVAAGALSAVGIILTPMIASACMSLSSLFVVTNALRIKGYKKTIKGEFMLLKIEGMMCKHCEKKVFETLSGVAGVEKVEINLKKKTAKVFGSASALELKTAVDNAGYEVVSIKE